MLAKGKARLTGVMADGTKVSATKLQALLSEDGSTVCIPVIVPMYKGKLGGFGFTTWLAANGKVDASGVSGWDASSSTTAKFTADLSCVDATLLAAPADGQYTFAVDADEFPATIGSLPVLTDMLPQTSTVTSKSGKLSAAADSVTKLKISRVATTGLFKGSFLAYTQNGTKMNKKTVSFNGVIVNGTGYGAVKVKGEGTAAVTLK